MPTEDVEVYADGVLIATEQVEVSQGALNERTLVAQAATALANNTAYLAIASPSQVQAVAQVEALTRQVNKLIRLVLNRLDDTE